MTVGLFLVALGLVVAGVAFIYWPAALIVAGVLAGIGVFGYERGETS